MQDCPRRSSSPAAGVEAVEQEEDEDEDDGQEDPEQPEDVTDRQDRQPDVLHLLQEGGSGFIYCINDSFCKTVLTASLVSSDLVQCSDQLILYDFSTKNKP